MPSIPRRLASGIGKFSSAYFISDDIYNYFKEIGAYKDNTPTKEMDLVQNHWLHNNNDAWDSDYVSDDDTTNLLGDDTEIH